jgi:pimeloyl-ACP methyl ester carboxylesterase
MQRKVLKALRHVICSCWLAALLAIIGVTPAVAQLAMVPVTLDGATVRLATITHKPAGNGPFPTLIFHHGSTGTGRDSALFARPYDPVSLANWFTARGWAVVFPARRGRGGSEGLYDEGFEADRSRGYICDDSVSVQGADRALRDIDAITASILAQPFVDRSRFIVGGQSRGGILSVAWSGMRPNLPKGVINFVGGWQGGLCRTATKVNGDLFKRGAAFRTPSLWLYGDNDTYYPLIHSRGNFEAFRSAGGSGSFNEYKLPEGTNGHFVAAYPHLWEAAMERYLGERGLPAKHASRPMTDDEIKASLAGKRVTWNDGLLVDYRADGSFEMISAGKTTATGRYTIAKGELCTSYDSGRSRCDRINRDARGIFMTTAIGSIYYAEAR